MDIELQAKAAIQETARRLEELLEIALREKRYRELGAISPLAQAITTIVKGFEDQSALTENAATRESRDREPTTDLLPKGNVGAAVEHKSESVAAARAKTEVAFPQFRIDGDKLVKIGWSKKDKCTYEHRAPRDGVFQLAATLEERVRPGTAFKMEHFIPFRVGKGEELPTYQTYLALAWFRSLGIVEEIGKLGYRFDEGALDKRKIQSYWAKLPKA